MKEDREVMELWVKVSPIRGTESDVAGMISATSSMKTVRDSSTVIPAQTQHKDLHLHKHSVCFFWRFNPEWVTAATCTSWVLSALWTAAELSTGTNRRGGGWKDVHCVMEGRIPGRITVTWICVVLPDPVKVREEENSPPTAEQTESREVVPNTWWRFSDYFC